MGSKAAKSKSIAPANLPRRRSSRIALRRGEEGTDETEVVEIEVEETRGVEIDVEGTRDVEEGTEEHKGVENIVLEETENVEEGPGLEETRDGQVEETAEMYLEGGLVKVHTEDETADGKQMDEVDVGSETVDVGSTDADTVDVCTTDVEAVVPGISEVETVDVCTTDVEEVDIGITEVENNNIDTNHEVEMEVPTNVSEDCGEKSNITAPDVKDFKHQTVNGNDSSSPSTSSGLANTNRVNYNRVVDSEEEMEASMAETCSTLLGTPHTMSSNQVAIGPSVASRADCDRMKKVFKSGLAIHFSGEEMEACKAVATDLFPHQRVALAWMVRHENTNSEGMRGGILADDMGLGKSLTVISLVMTNFWDGRPLLKPELGFVRRRLSVRRKKGKGQRKNKMARISAEDFGVGRKLGAGKAARKSAIGGLFDKFRNNNQETGCGDKFKFGKDAKRYKMDEEDNFIDDDSSELSDDSEESLDVESEVDGDASEEGSDDSDPEFDPKLNMDGFIDESDSDDEIKHRKKKALKRKIYDSESEDSEKEHEPRKPTTAVLSKKVKVAASQPPSNSGLPATPCDDTDSDQDSLPDVGDDPPTLPVPTHIPSNPLQPQTRRNEETGLKLIIPPRQPAERNGRRRATLLVCPTSLISHWLEQLEMHLDRSVDIKVKVHHGTTKAQTVEELVNADIVISTYGVIASEWGMQGASPLFKVKWLRVVMDEGHCIKNHNTKTAKAALNLDTSRKWIVTGTPIQNNLMDLWSLVNWLDFGLYAGKTCMKLYKEQIERPCKAGDPKGFERLQVLMDAICLRRTKTDKKKDGSPLVELPSKTILTRQVVLNEEDRFCYAAYHKFAANLVSQYHRRGELLRNYAHVFVLMTRLRQLCCHRELYRDVDWEQVVRDKDLALQLQEPQTGTSKEEQERLVNLLKEMIKSGVSDECSICLGGLVSPVITQCGHVFCRACIEQVVDMVKPPACPLCRNLVQKKELLEAGQDDDDEETDHTLADMEDIIVNVSSSKINAAIKEMIRIRRDMPDDKIIVVSQFTSFLSILQPLLRENNFPTVRLDGSMTHMNRSEAVSVFQSTHPNSPKVMLLSLKAGGVGLNLTAANHLLLLDPAWNPAVEWQCFDRTHRMGQNKDVTIYKFITKDSIEEKMLEIQAKKEKLITGAFHMPAEERRKQRVEEIRSIFGI